MKTNTKTPMVQTLQIRLSHGYFFMKMSLIFFIAMMSVLLFNCQSDRKKSSESKNVATEKSFNLVETEYGKIQGEQLNQVVRFLGIPYAQSISGKNRFMPPQPLDSWEGVLTANRYADTAPQQAADPMGGSPVTPAFKEPDYVKIGDECLALNIWKPTIVKEKLPVMVWLHGGGWTSGSGSCKIYDGENLASRGDVVVVTLNHRLGASGLVDLSRVLGGDFKNASNLGIKDIIAALEWIQRNIESFGGDPDVVTIFGESGGGWKVNTLLGVPSAKGLFHRAIVESGPLTRFMTAEEADKIANNFLKELKVTPDNAEVLNDISLETVLKAEAAVLKNTPMSFQAPGFPTGFWPVIDGEIILEHVYDPEATPSSIHVPLLLGQTGTEFTLFMLRDEAAYNLDESGLKTRVSGMLGENVAQKIIETYQADYPSYVPSALWFRIFSDYAMGALSSEILDKRSVVGAASVYAYRFDWQTPIYDGKLYSPHTIEIPFVFDNVTTEAGTIMTGGGEEAALLAKRVSNAWIAFAKTGSPITEDFSVWPIYTKEKRESMHLDIKSTVKPYMNPHMLELFHSLLWERAGLKP